MIPKLPEALEQQQTAVRAMFNEILAQAFEGALREAAARIVDLEREVGLTTSTNRVLVGGLEKHKQKIADLEQRVDAEVKLGLSMRARCEGQAQRLSAMVEQVRDEHVHQGDECSVCAVLACPHSDPLHLHHDGCPSCSTPAPQPIDPGSVPV